MVVRQCNTGILEFRGQLVHWNFGEFVSGLAKTRVFKKKPNPAGFFGFFFGIFGFFWVLSFSYMVYIIRYTLIILVIFPYKIIRRKNHLKSLLTLPQISRKKYGYWLQYSAIFKEWTNMCTVKLLNNGNPNNGKLPNNGNKNNIVQNIFFLIVQFLTKNS